MTRPYSHTAYSYGKAGSGRSVNALIRFKHLTSILERLVVEIFQHCRNIRFQLMDRGILVVAQTGNDSSSDLSDSAFNGCLLLRFFSRLQA